MNKVILTGIIIALTSVAVVAMNSHSKEGFWMTPSRTWKVDKMFKDPSTQDFFSTPNFQSILSPRFSNVDYGPDLRTQFPSYNRVGVPNDPLFESSMPSDPLDYAIAKNKMTGGNTYNSKFEGDARRAYADAFGSPRSGAELSSVPGNPYGTVSFRENFNSTESPRGFQTSKSIGGPAIPLDPHNPYSASFAGGPEGTSYANGNYNQVLNEIVQAGAVDGWPTSTVAELDSATFMTQDGEMKQPIIYDRYIYSNRNSRLRCQGDPIRGDLPIVPISGSWFIPSGAYEGPNIVLQQGAMNVMGGVNNETNNQLANLIYNSSGGAETAIGGIDMAQTSMNHNVYGAASAALGDVKMTAFP
jgi:hypothetical protein